MGNTEDTNFHQLRLNQAEVIQFNVYHLIQYKDMLTAYIMYAW